MIGTPKCYERGCVHFLGVDQPDGTEMTERVICEAYPNGIPVEIAYGNDSHLELRGDEENPVAFEKN
jgi:hypothetical protein